LDVGKDLVFEVWIGGWTQALLIDEPKWCSQEREQGSVVDVEIDSIKLVPSLH
jgi:hypothetical protein